MSPLKKIKILIVEDEASLSTILTEQLQLEGFITSSAANGQEGLTKALSELPDLILLDIVMPVMDGLTMLQKLRETNDYGHGVPVILLTNLSANTEDIIKKVATTEPAYYIVKTDMKMAQIIKKIRERLAKK